MTLWITQSINPTSSDPKMTSEMTKVDRDPPVMNLVMSLQSKADIYSSNSKEKKEQ